MYSKHFGFKGLPFSVSPDPRFFYDTPVYQDVFAGLQHGIATKGAFIVVTGEAGTGKTTLLRRLIHDSPRTIDYAFVNIRPRLSLPALLRAILKDLKVSSSSMDQQELLEELGSYVLDRFTKGRTVAFLFDESQGLGDELLVELPVLWNVAIESERLVPIVLMGQPELDKRLNSSKLRQLAQHITLRRRLIPFSDNDVGPYVATRLKHVGYRGKELFEPAAIETLATRSNGIPRLINGICDNALLCAYRASQYKVTAAMIDEIANQLRLVERSDRAKPADEVADLFRFIERRSSADKKRRTDEAINQPQFVETLLNAGGKKRNDVANQPRVVDRPPDQGQEEIQEAAGAPRFVDNPAANVNQKEHGEISQQPRFVDHISNAKKKRIDDDIDPLPFVDHSADHQLTPPKERENFRKASRAPSAQWRDVSDGAEMVDGDDVAASIFADPQNSGKGLSRQSIEASGRSGNLAEDESEQLAPSKVHQLQKVARHFSTSAAEAGNAAGLPAGNIADQPAAAEIDQPQKLEKSFSDFETARAVQDAWQKARDELIPLTYQVHPVRRLNYQLGKANRVMISIGALILLVVAGGLAVFYPRQHDAAEPEGYVENIAAETNSNAVRAMPVNDVRSVDDLTDKKIEEEPREPVPVAPATLPNAAENREQKRDTPKKPNVVEDLNIAKTNSAPQETYRVSRASFLRKRPAANADIIDTLRPGTRIVVTNRSGEYLTVRSSDGKVSGFVHKEDAFFERIRQ